MIAILRSRALPAVALLLGLAPFVSPISAAPREKEEAAPQDSKEKAKSQGFRFVFKDCPSFRFGDKLRIDLKARVQVDFRAFTPDLETKEGAVDLRRARIGIEGKFLKHFEYEVEYELHKLLRPLGERAEIAIVDQWKDVYVDYSYFKSFQIRGGKFKLPFSLDQMTSVSKLDFIQRSRIGEFLAPARDIGVEAHGRLFKRALNYQAGLFERDGENARYGTNPGAERTFAGRLTGTPLRPLAVPEFLKGIEFGAAFTSSSVPEGAKGIRAETVAGARFFPLKGDTMFVHGERLRVGTELSWMPGPFSLKGEYIHFRDERLGQSLRGTDLPDFVSRGWYLSGTWALTGEPKAAGIEPRRPFLQNRGFGAIELAIRSEQIRFGSSEHPGSPQRNQRAANILPASDRLWTFGANWYLNRWLKLQFNAIREKIEDTLRGPIEGEGLLWTRILRLQVAM